ncbi:serine hydrolase domain-containing protein [Streptomyces rhizosphaericus]|uniref:Beta-lactamase family protein n=1 Tax=Streptomyces rhizosphaericus TaxID=114699 RepID=A0A6G4AGI7_9ACTN|nr:serine hydrolase domain-containing protein [Streptomyces rhizosphaericus]NEW71617.1 beta-lactamase family protein [Streptomyces rhizosphaericus]
MTFRPIDSHHVLSRRSTLTAAGIAAVSALGVDGAEARSRHPSTSSRSGLAPGAEPIAENLLDTTPENQAATYRHVDRQRLATRAIHTDPARTTPLPRSGTSLSDVRYVYQGTRRTVRRFVSENRIAGLLVLKDGAIAHEQYAMGNTETTRWTSMSIAKSVTSTLIGAGLADGAIGGLDDPVLRYVPELKGSAYQDNTIRQLLQMSSGVKWIEAGANDPYGDNDIARMFKGIYGKQRGAVMELMRTRPRAAAPGSVFNYSTGEAYVLSAVVANATGKTASHYLSEKIWRPLGMEADAYWILDAPGGREMGGSCIQATLRDYGRFGQFILTGGGGVVPRGWRDQAGRPESRITDYGRLYEGSPYGYGYLWWAIPPGVAGARGRVPTFVGLGHGGQKLYINPAEGIVAVLWSALRPGVDVDPELFALLDSVVRALR